VSQERDTWEDEIRVRLHSDLKKGLARVADSRHMTMSELIRELIRAVVIEQKKPRTRRGD
jgi:antitoxin component of RelBE/YafQ-DinJ toxin-antitoxin module